MEPMEPPRTESTPRLSFFTRPAMPSPLHYEDFHAYTTPPLFHYTPLCLLHSAVLLSPTPARHHTSTTPLYYLPRLHHCTVESPTPIPTTVRSSTPLCFHHNAVLMSPTPAGRHTSTTPLYDPPRLHHCTIESPTPIPHHYSTTHICTPL